MSIGFACLSMKLEANTNSKEIFDLSFTKVKAGTAVKGGKINPTSTTSITNRNKTINMQFNLNSPRDELSYIITVKNEGNLPAEIINIIAAPDYQDDPKKQAEISPVVISQNDIVGQVLEPEEEVELKVTVLYKMGTITEPKKISYQLTLIAASPETER